MSYFLITNYDGQKTSCEAANIDVVKRAYQYDYYFPIDIQEVTEDEAKKYCFEGLYPTSKEQPEIGMFLCDQWNGRYYITGIDGDRILYREFYEDDPEKIIVFGQERWLDIDEFNDCPQWTVCEIPEGFEIVKEY